MVEGRDSARSGDTPLLCSRRRRSVMDARSLFFYLHSTVLPYFSAGLIGLMERCTFHFGIGRKGVLLLVLPANKHKIMMVPSEKSR